MFCISENNHYLCTRNQSCTLMTGATIYVTNIFPIPVSWCKHDSGIPLFYEEVNLYINQRGFLRRPFKRAAGGLGLCRDGKDGLSFISRQQPHKQKPYAHLPHGQCKDRPRVEECP